MSSMPESGASRPGVHSARRPARRTRYPDLSPARRAAARRRCACAFCAAGHPCKDVSASLRVVDDAGASGWPSWTDFLVALATDEDGGGQ